MKTTNYKLQATKGSSGQAIIGSVIFLVLLSTVIIAGFVGPLTRQLKTARAAIDSRQSFFAAESGIEDAIYRLRKKLPYVSSYVLPVFEAEAAISITEAGNDRIIQSVGEVNNHERKLLTKLDLSGVGVELFYGIQVGDGGLVMKNNALVNGNVYSNGSILGSNGARINGGAIVAGGLIEPPDVDFPDQDNDQFFADAINREDIAQPFTPSVDGPVGRASVYLARVGDPSDLTLRIARDSDNEPGSTISNGTAVLSASDIGLTPSWVHTAFTNPPSLNAGERYWLVLDSNNYNATQHWNWRKDLGFEQDPEDFFKLRNNASRSWTAGSGILAHQIWLGGTNTEISNMIVEEVGWANAFTNGTTCGGGCTVANPARAELPISDGVIEDWRKEAELGGVITENYLIETNETIGPIKIEGDLNVNIDVDEHIVINGTVYVTGNINFICGNGSTINLASGYGTDSGLIMADGSIVVGNHCSFDGSGQPESYIMVLSARDDNDSVVLDVSNNSAGVIYYANKGLISLNNVSIAKEATAYGVVMQQNSIINYESGLGNLNFNSGPGGAFGVETWREIE